MRRSCMKRMIRRGIVLLAIIPMIAFIAIFLSPAGGWAACSIFGCSENSLPDDPGKFNGMWWGQYLGEIKDMRLAGYDLTNAREVYYVRQGDVLQMGDAKLDYIQYGFWKDIYSSLIFGISGAANWEALKEVCFDNFERWHKPDWRVERYIWVGKHSAMTLEYDEPLSQGRLYIYSKTIYERQLARARGEGTGRRSNNAFRLY
jgi:hypothetical protein